MRLNSYSKLLVCLIIIVLFFTPALLFYDYYFYHYTEIGKLLYNLRKSPDSEERAESAFELGEKRDNSAVPGLIAALKYDIDERVRGAAGASLANMKDKRAVEPLIFALENDKSDSRRIYSMALGTLDDDRASPALEDVLKNDPDKYVRLTAATSLNYLGNPIGFDFLISSLTDENPFLAGAAANALEEFNGERAIGPLISILENTSIDERVRTFAVQTLGVIDNGFSVNAIISYLDNNPDEWARSACVLALGQFTDEKAITPLIRVLENDSDENIRINAGFALGRLMKVFKSEEAELALGIALGRKANAGANAGLAWAHGLHDYSTTGLFSQGKMKFYSQLVRARWGVVNAFETIIDDFHYKRCRAYYDDIFSRMPESFPKYNHCLNIKERQANLRAIRRWFKINKSKLRWHPIKQKYFISNKNDFSDVPIIMQ